MFLDDKAVQMCRDAQIDTAGDMQKFYKELCAMFESYYKQRITPTSTRTHIKATIDRTFKLWDSAVNQLLKSGDGKLIILGDLMREYPFKDNFFAHKELSEVYNRL